MNESEQVNEKCVALSTKGTKMTAKVLAKLMLAVLNKAKKPHNKKGKQSFKSLTKSGASLADIEISNVNIGSFKKTARKYGIDFALKRDDSESPPRWIAFFKAKDSRMMELAFKEYAGSTALKENTKKVPMLEKLAKANEMTKATPHKVLERVKDIAGMAR